MPVTADDIKAQRIVVAKNQLIQVQAQKDVNDAQSELGRLTVQKQLDDLSEQE